MLPETNIIKPNFNIFKPGDRVQSNSLVPMGRMFGVVEGSCGDLVRIKDSAGDVCTSHYSHWELLP